VAAALLCHAGLLYGFQIALHPLPAPEPQTVIEMALVPPPGNAIDGGRGRAPAEVPRPALLSSPPRAAEIRPPQRAPQPAAPRPRPAPAPAPTEVPTPAEAPPRSESQAPAESSTPATLTAPQPAAGTSASAGSRGAAGGANGTASAAGSGTGPGTPGVRAKPRYRANPAPIYPALARSRHQEGLVLLRVSVTAEGRASGAELEKSSGFSALDEAALEAVRDWEFEPARVGPRAVGSEIQVPIRFQLAD